MIMDDISKNWPSYIKVGALLIALIAWGLNVQAKMEDHFLNTKDNIKLLLLICANTAKNAQDEVRCYKALERQ